MRCQADPSDAGLGPPVCLPLGGVEASTDCANFGWRFSWSPGSSCPLRDAPGGNHWAFLTCANGAYPPGPVFGDRGQNGTNGIAAFMVGLLLNTF